MKTGVSTGCFFPMETHQSLLTLAKLGVKYTEIFFNTDSELELEYIYKLKEVADCYQMQVVSVHPFTSAIETFYFFSKHDYKIADAIKLYEKYFRACNILGCKYVVFHGCFENANYMTMDKYTKILNLLATKAQEYGVHLCQENVVHYKCGYLENLKYVIEHAHPNLRYVFDLKQAVRANQDIYGLLQIMGEKISHIHISDFNKDANSLLPSQGDFDFQVFLDFVKRYTKTEYWLIEVYQENITDVNMLKKSVDFLSFL